MLKTIREILHTGTATVQYPFAPIERPKDARGKPEHDAEKCIACSACAVACPPNAIQTVLNLVAGTKSWSINYGRCVFCGRCEEVCPTNAIKLSKEFELAVMDKNDLEEICTYSLKKCQQCGEYFAPTKAVDYAARILAQYSDDDEVKDALDSLSICMHCKQKRDAYRYQRLSAQAGDLL